MDIHCLSPYIRMSGFNNFPQPFLVDTRVLFDYELCYIEQGKHIITFDRNKEIICEKDDIILVRPNQANCWRGISENCRHWFIHFDFIYLANSKEVYVSFKDKCNFQENELLMIRQDIIKEWNMDIPNVFRLENSSYTKGLFAEICILDAKKNLRDQTLCKAKMMQLIAVLFERFLPNVLIPVDKDNLLLSVKSYIDTNYFSPISMDLLSNQFHVSKYHLNREFKRFFGESVIQYYNSVRFKQAKDALEEGISVQDISKSLAFETVYSFSHFFKKHSGLSPTLYNK